MKHYVSPFYNANTFIVHIHPLQTKQLLKYNNPFLHSKKTPINPHPKTIEQPSPTQRVLELARMTSGGNTENANVRNTNHLTPVNHLEDSNRCRAVKALHPWKTRLGSCPSPAQTSRLLETKGAEVSVLSTGSTSGAHYKLHLENRSVSGLFSMTTTSVRKPQQGEGKAPDENPWHYSCQCTEGKGNRFKVSKILHLIVS